MKKGKLQCRYNKILISRITGIKDEDEIKKFMIFAHYRSNSFLIHLIMSSMQQY